MTRIVVGVDRSPESRTALRWAHREALLRGATLDVVLAWGWLDQYRGRAKFEPFYDGRAAAVALNEFVASSLPGADLATVQCKAVDGFAGDVLLEAAGGADLLVVGPRGSGGLLDRLGSVTERCLEAMSCATVIARGDSLPTGDSVETVVVGVDGSCGSVAALSWAAEEGRLRRARLAVLSASVDEDATGDVERAIAEVDVIGAACLTRSIVAGKAAMALIDASRSADLVVVGSRIRSGVERLLSRSVSVHVARRASCSVVVVPTSRSRRFVTGLKDSPRSLGLSPLV